MFDNLRDYIARKTTTEFADAIKTSKEQFKGE